MPVSQMASNIFINKKNQFWDIFVVDHTCLDLIWTPHLNAYGKEKWNMFLQLKTAVA